MPTISNNPRGFAGLVGLNDMGANPRNLADTIAPVVDQTPWYLTGRREFVGASSPLTINGVGTYSFPDLEVPIGEVWFVHFASVRSGAAVVGAATAFRIQPAILLGTNSPIVAVNSPAKRYVTDEGVQAPYPQGLILAAGNRLGFYVEEWLAGGVGHAVISSAIITRLEQ